MKSSQNKRAEYVVYRHTCPNGKVYIGITNNVVRRWNCGHGYDGQVFGRAVYKYGWNNIRHEILFDGLSREDAEKAEIEQIAIHKSFDARYGYNMDMGGRGSLGHKCTDEQRKCIGRRAAEMWKDEKMREHLTAHLRELATRNIGKPLSKDRVAALIAKTSTPVDKYDTSGNLICTYSSASDAARDCGAKSNSLICACCAGKKKTAYGFIWKKHGEPLDDEDVAWSNSVKKDHYRPVEMFDTNGNLLARYESVHEAGRQTGISYKAIWDGISRGRIRHGYIWRYANS